MNKDKTEKKTAAGCLIIVALFFIVLAVYQYNEEKQARQVRQEIKHLTPASFRADTIIRRNRIVTGALSPTTSKDADSDSYDNPDFDDLIPGEEYDEEFVDRSEGDRELYDDP
ncbi:hypothetical protein [Hoylesella timonensis]|uniref:hypothetical protein n=1 Tax=Hoylesella timonensis TaxID=386414 RepID=UPI0024324C23|nr:hypothetical protein [Hoylesella timonensis]